MKRPATLAERARITRKQAADARPVVNDRYLIEHLQEINRTLLPDYPGKTPTPDSIGLARAQIIALIGDITENNVTLSLRSKPR